MHDHSFQDKFNKYQDFYLYGASPYAAEVFNFINKKGKNVIAYVDKDPAKQGLVIFGIPVISPDQLLNELAANSAIIIVSAFIEDIYSFLISNDIPAGRIFPLVDSMFFPTYGPGYLNNSSLDRVSSYLSDNEKAYLESWRAFKETGNIGLLKPIKCKSRIQYDYRPWSINMRHGQCALDVGAFDGKTAVDFWKSGNFSKVVSFEPFSANYKQLCQTIERFGLANKVQPLKVALGSTNREYCVKPREVSSRSSTLGESQNSGEVIQERTLDSYQWESISMIKVDIEGDELKFLEGAKATIIKERPHLAISAYHHKSHCVRIFEFIESLGLPFRVNIGHHPSALYELEYYFSFNT